MCGPELIATYRDYFEFAKRRVTELRAGRDLAEAEIVDRVPDELLELHPDWEQQIWAAPAGPQLAIASLNCRPRRSGCDDLPTKRAPSAGIRPNCRAIGRCELLGAHSPERDVASLSGDILTLRPT